MILTRFSRKVIGFWSAVFRPGILLSFPGFPSGSFRKRSGFCWNGPDFRRNPAGFCRLRRRESPAWVIQKVGSPVLRCLLEKQEQIYSCRMGGYKVVTGFNGIMTSFTLGIRITLFYNFELFWGNNILDIHFGYPRTLILHDITHLKRAQSET